MPLVFPIQLTVGTHKHLTSIAVYPLLVVMLLAIVPAPLAPLGRLIA